MDFCDNETVIAYFRVKNMEGKEMQILLYKIFVPILLVGCLFSLILNLILVAVGSASRQTIRSRSPILVLSLNLAATDCLASFLIGLSFVINSFLPVVLQINIESPMKSCSLLMLEVFRLSSLIASATHLLAMALVHYKGIVNPIHYRSVIFCSQHRTRSIYLMTFTCWVVPAVLLTAYFSLIPCQGFQSNNCRVEFITTFRFRAIILVVFFIPLICMSVLYFRIFRIIKDHQKARACQRQQSCQISIRSRSYARGVSTTGTTPVKPSPLLMSSHSTHTDTTLLRYNSNGVSSTANEEVDEPVKTKRNGFMPPINFRRKQLQRQARFNSLMVTTTEEQMIRTVLYKQENETDNKKTKNPSQLEDSSLGRFNWSCCKKKLKPSHSSQSVSSSSATSDLVQNQINIPATINKTRATNGNGSIKYRENMYSNLSKRQPGSVQTRLGQTSHSLSFDPSLGNTGHTKALVTTLLILGTYLLCYMPAVFFFAITCIDHCPFPITQMDWRLRISIAFVTNGLVVLKAIVDPMIYTYRMREMKSALNRFVRLPFCKEASNGTQSMNLSHTPLRATVSNRSEKMIENSSTKQNSLTKCIVGL